MINRLSQSDKTKGEFWICSISQNEAPGFRRFLIMTTSTWTEAGPYPGLHCALRSAKEGLDTQMLFDPLEEQPGLPAATIPLGNGARRQNTGRPADKTGAASLKPLGCRTHG